MIVTTLMNLFALGILAWVAIVMCEVARLVILEEERYRAVRDHFNDAFDSAADLSITSRDVAVRVAKLAIFWPNYLVVYALAWRRGRLGTELVTDWIEETVGPR